MSDDLNKKIKQITDMLSQENMPDNLKGLLSLLTNSGEKADSSAKEADVHPAKEVKNEKNELNENIEMIRKVTKIMDKFNSANDPRINLLMAVKPFLNNKRQMKVANCINILRMSSVARIMDDYDKDTL